jgi:tetratricopeptide (TPR) repeat protein
MKTGEYIERGLNLVKVEEYDSALKHFRELPDLTEHSTATSYYALCLAVVEEKFEEAIALCLAAVKREFYNPDIYLNLGMIYMLNSQKALAIRVFRKGLLIDDSHKEIKQKILEMGIRQKPPFSFLSRNNIANKYLGRVARGRQQGRGAARKSA